MTDHEMVLLRAAVEARQGYEVRVEQVPQSGWWANASGPFNTLADALTALLRDLGADVPEWPSDERVAELRRSVRHGREGLGEFGRLPLPELLALRGAS